MKKRGKTAILILFMALTFGQTAHADLAAVGPVNAALFPEWYQDFNQNFNGMTVGLCLDGNGITGPCIFDAVRPLNPTSVQAGFGTEAMYWSADAEMLFPNGGRALLVLALEAAFDTLTGEAEPGTQVTFQRVRLRIDVPEAGTYTITHPYGVEVFEGVSAGRRTINRTVDIMGLPGVFTTALTGPIGPNLLVWDTGPYIDPVTGNQYAGHPLTPHKVTGSVNNFFRIEAKDSLGNPIDLNGAAPGFALETDLFLVSGKIIDAGAPPPPPPPATPTPLTINRTTLVGTGAVTQVDVFVTSVANATVTVVGPGIDQILQPDPAAPGTFFGRVASPELTPLSLTISAVAPDLAPTTITVPFADVRDVVTIKSAKFNTRTGVLTVTAITNAKKQAGIIPILEVFDQAGNSLGVINRGIRNLRVAAPPSSITVKSSKGGVSTVLTTIR